MAVAIGPQQRRAAGLPSQALGVQVPHAASPFGGAHARWEGLEGAASAHVLRLGVRLFWPRAGWKARADIDPRPRIRVRFAWGSANAA